MTSTRSQIIEKTCELLETQGYYATGLNQIVKESGSPKGSLYYHFPGGKEELAAASIARVGEMVLSRIRANLALIDTPAESIRSFLVTIGNGVVMSGFRAGGPITTIAMETASTSDSLREECHRIYEGWQAAFFDKLVTGGISHDRARRLSVLIIASIEGGVILCRTSRSSEPLEAIAEEIALLVQNAA